MAGTLRLDDDTTRAHRTTDNGLRSIGRYRDDMNDDLRALCLEIGADLLSRFGYATNAYGGHRADDAASVRA